MSPSVVLEVADFVWARRKSFVCWPTRSLVLWSGLIRNSKGKYAYPDSVRVPVRAAGITLDPRSNGPAIVAFLLAGGQRPTRVGVNHGWSIHHIYDGLHPSPGRSASSHSVKEGHLFTESAGLVAVHPLADALAAEVPYFAWCLRYEAFLRFGFDPDSVFSDATVSVADSRITATLTPPAIHGATPMSSSQPKVSYRSTRLHFKANLIEPLSDDEVFEIVTPDATWRMTKAQFYPAFPNVVASKSYAGSRREYFYPNAPKQAGRFLV